MYICKGLEHWYATARHSIPNVHTYSRLPTDHASLAMHVCTVDAGPNPIACCSLTFPGNADGFVDQAR